MYIFIHLYIPSFKYNILLQMMKYYKNHYIIYVIINCGVNKIFKNTFLYKHMYVEQHFYFYFNFYAYVQVRYMKYLQCTNDDMMNNFYLLKNFYHSIRLIFNFYDIYSPTYMYCMLFIEYFILFNRSRCMMLCSVYGHCHCLPSRQE